MRRTRQTQQGFALILTLALVALLVALLVGLSLSVRTASQISTASLAQRQARQHALAAMNVAIGELQKFTGTDNVVTAMAGVTGAAPTLPGPGNPMRHWCGVWSASGVFQTWLSSSPSPRSVLPTMGSDTVRLAGAISVADTNGAESTNREFVDVARLPITGQRDGIGNVQVGHVAYWVSDEGVKLSAYVSPADAMVPGAPHAISEIVSSLTATAADLPRVGAFNQLALVSTAANPLSATALAPAFHQITVAHYGVVTTLGTPVLKGGILNVNSTSGTYWKGIAGTYNAANPSKTLSVTTTTIGNRATSNFLASTGHAAGGPFLSVSDFVSSSALTAMLASTGVSKTDFQGAIGGMLSTRSDTFRIRAYGDAVNPLDNTQVLGIAYCEAVVQRMVESGPFGDRRYRVIYFRWLSPDDI